MKKKTETNATMFKTDFLDTSHIRVDSFKLIIITDSYNLLFILPAIAFERPIYLIFA